MSTLISKHKINDGPYGKGPDKSQKTLSKSKKCKEDERKEEEEEEEEEEKEEEGEEEEEEEKKKAADVAAPTPPRRRQPSGNSGPLVFLLSVRWLSVDRIGRPSASFVTVQRPGGPSEGEKIKSATPLPPESRRETENKARNNSQWR